MLFNSIEFLLFFPLAVAVCFLVPKKARVLWLLVTSYVFYMGWNAAYALLLLFSTVVTFVSGLMIDRFRGRWGAKLWLTVCLLVNFGLLFFFKYFGFAVETLNDILGFLGKPGVSPGFSVLLPVGISFYIFQALSYSMDVYRGDVEVEHNLIRYAAFVSFFPQLVAGPIERSSHLLVQFRDPPSFDADRMRRGLQQMIWGFFEKIVIADRAAIFVQQIYDYSGYYQGFEIVVGMLLTALQIYCDFAGYSDIAIGAAQVLGFDLMKNFRQPYFAVSISDFWRRWHISLSTWFRDYLYIPLGGNRRGKVRQYINLMIVFLTSGLWHGAAWNYIFWGGLNGVYQVVGGMTRKTRKKAAERLGMHSETFSHRLGQIIITFILTDIAWVFFRASTVGQAFSMLKSAAVFNPWVLTDGTLLTMGLGMTDWLILLSAAGTLLAVSIMHECGWNLRERLEKQEAWFRGTLTLAGLFAVLLFGVYGPGFDSAAFIYFQF